MKKNLCLITFVIMILISVSCSEKKLPTSPVMEIETFPSVAGTSYIYVLTFGQSNSITGMKKSIIFSKVNNNPNDGLVSIYQPQLDSVIYQGNTLVDTSYFRKTSSGVFYFIDTTGISQLVPDTLRSLLAVDTESRALFFPLSINQTWPVYQIDIKIGGLPIFSPLKAYGKVLESNKVEFVLRNSKIISDVFKIEYNLEIQLSPEGQVEKQTAIAYFAVGIGFIKWEGNSSVANLVRGSSLVYPNDNVLEELTSYNIP